jgi:hypothetical protein
VDRAGSSFAAEPVELSGVVPSAFLPVATNREAFVNPMSIEEAAERVRSRLDRPETDFLVFEEPGQVQALQWLEAAGSGGDLTMDAPTAAIAHRRRAAVHTTDIDPGRLPGVRWRNQLL